MRSDRREGGEVPGETETGRKGKPPVAGRKAARRRRPEDEEGMEAPLPRDAFRGRGAGGQEAGACSCGCSG